MCRRVSGFTLVELLVVMLLMALLMGLVVGAVAGVRNSATAARCLSNTRTCAIVFHHYAAENKGYLPFGGYERRVVTLEGWDPFPVGGDLGIRAGSWVLLFADEWGATRRNVAFQCPLQSRALGLGTYASSVYSSWPQYHVGSAFWTHPLDLQPEQAAEVEHGVYAPRVDDVWSPSKKVLLYEQAGFCVPGALESGWVRIGQTPYFVTSNVSVDGSAMRMKQADGLPAARGQPFDGTAMGVWGRDRP